MVGRRCGLTFERELRALHLGEPVPERSVFSELTEAYDAVLARKAAGAIPS